jgi:hypothetical protein
MPEPRLPVAGYCLDKCNQTSLEIYIIISSKSNVSRHRVVRAESFPVSLQRPTHVVYARKFDPNQHLSAFLAVEVPLQDTLPDERFKK